MVQAMINISEQANTVLCVVKAKFGLRDKSEAIDLVARQYEACFLEPSIRPEYRQKLEAIAKGRHLSRNEMEKAVKRCTATNIVKK